MCFPEITPTTPLALASPSAIHFLQFLLRNNDSTSNRNSSTLLIICSTRNDFIHSLLTTSTSPTIHPPAAPLLTSLLLPSSFTTIAAPIKLAFTPTYLHLRAYLSTLAPTDTPGTLAIWGLVEAHSGTTEFSAQGIARTAALAVATGVATARKLIVGGLQGRSISGTEAVSSAVMGAQVPILNSTIRLGKDMGSVASEKVCVRDVLSRWFLWREYCGDDGYGSGVVGDEKEEGEVGEEVVLR